MSVESGLAKKESRSDIFRARGLKIPTYVLDADGKQIQIETRNDEEQQIKYGQIVDMLVNAGYYRAQIKGLSPFDMIVGGMTWCIDASDIDIDVDLLFEESLTIGQKISLTEKIIVVLPGIKCPYFIEPHQIQGLDFIHVHPVIEWLIKWSAEIRRNKAHYLREYALNEFHKRFAFLQGDKSVELVVAKASKNILAIIEKYSEKRKTNFTPEEMLAELEKAENLKMKLKEEMIGISIENNEIKERLEEDSSLTDGLSAEELKKLKIIRALLSEGEEKKAEIKRFKEDCRKEAEELQNKIDQLENPDESEDAELEQELNALEGKLKSAKLELGSVTQQLAAKERILDEIPSRAELAQYQKRFMELYNQMAVKHRETKQYYTMFNTLNDKLGYLQKQLSIFNSIQESYSTALDNPKSQEEFLKQFSSIVTGVQQTKLKVLQKRNDARTEKERLNYKLEELRERKRKYVAAVKEFSLECQKSQELSRLIREGGMGNGEKPRLNVNDCGNASSNNDKFQ